MRDEVGDLRLLDSEGDVMPSSEPDGGGLFLLSLFFLHRDLSSPCPIPLSYDGLPVNSGDCNAVGERLFKNGTKTESSISSYTLDTAVSRVSGVGGEDEKSVLRRGSLTSDGRLTSLDPLG